MGAVPTPGVTHAGSILERCFFTLIAAEFLLITFVSFVPNSLAIIEGTKANPPLLIHGHAALMYSWLIAFLAQAYFVSSGRLKLHVEAGKLFFVLGIGVAISSVYFSLFWPGDGFGKIKIPMAVERIGLFSLFLYMAFVSRGKNSESHKRYIMLATLIPLDAALNRMPWLPTFGLVWATPIWVILLLSQLVVYDVVRLGTIHKATAIGGGLISAYWLGMIFLMKF